MLELTRSARMSELAGDHCKAVELNSAALAMVYQLAKQYPDDPVHSQMLGSILYSHANFLAGALQYDKALTTLTKCEETYSRLPQDRFPVRSWLADVAARRGMIHARFGAGASAVTEMQWAVRGYLILSGGNPENPHYIDLARVLADNAMVHTHFGDPDLAMASADTAIRMFLAERDRTNARSNSVIYSTSAVHALAVAAVIHKAKGREDVSREAVDLGRRFSVDGPKIDELIAGNQESFSARRSPLTLSEALDTAATLLGREQVPETLQKFAELEEKKPGIIPQVIPFDRFASQLDLAPGIAAAIAEVAMNMLPRHPDAGLRLGLEAHYIFAGVSRPQTPAMRYQFHTYGPVWARVLLACSRLCDAQPESKPLALDLAAWAGAQAMQLMQLNSWDAELRSLAQTCLEHHGKLLIAAGREAEGKEALQVAADFNAKWPRASEA